MLNKLQETAEKARQKPKTIVFPEGSHPFIIRAARALADAGTARPLLIGMPTQIREKGASMGIRTHGIRVIHPLHDRAFDQRTKQLRERLRNNGFGIYDASERLSHPLWYASMLLHDQEVDMGFAGLEIPATSMLKTAIKIIGTKRKEQPVFGYAFMSDPTHDQRSALADILVIPRPTPQQLAYIALQTARQFEQWSSLEARTAFLSFSTTGSAQHALVDTVRQAVSYARHAAPYAKLDGELQFDAAVAPDVAQKKAPQSALQGSANVFIFPSLNAAHIGGHIAKELAGYTMYGPFVHGLNRPLHYLPASCSVDEIVQSVTVACCLN